MQTGILLNGLPTAQSDRIAILNEMNVKAVRDSILTPSVNPDSWKGSNRLNMWRDNGISLFLNINYQAQGKENQFPTGSQIGGHCKISQLIASKYPAIYYTPENEPLNTSLHAGTKEQYIDMLKPFIEAIHTIGGKVCDGGTTTPILRALTYRYLETKDAARASKFLNECIPTKDRNWLVNRTSKAHEGKLIDGLWYLYSICELPIDAINFHLYFPLINRGSTEPESPNGIAGFTDIIEFLQDTCPGKTLVSNETGLVIKDYAVSQSLLAGYENTGIQDLCLYSQSGTSGAYHNTDLSLTKNGNGLRDYLLATSL